MAASRTPQHGPSMAPFVLFGGMAAAVAAIWFGYPGLLALPIGLAVAAFVATPAILTGRKDSSGYPTAASLAEQTAVNRYRMWGELKWRAISPTMDWLPGRPVRLWWLASVFLAAAAAAIPTPGFGEGWRLANSIGVFAFVSALNGALRRWSAPDDPCPGPTFNFIIAAFGRGHRIIVAAAGASITALVVFFGTIIGVDKLGISYMLYPVAPWMLAGALSAAAVVSILTLTVRNQSLQQWKTMVHIRAEWEPRWQIAKLDPPPRLIGHEEHGNVQVDTFETHPSLGSQAVYPIIDKITASMGGGARVAILESPNVDSQDQPIEGSRHPLRFRVITFVSDDMPDLNNPGTDPAQVELLIASSLSWLSDRNGVGRWVFLECQPLHADPEAPSEDEDPEPAGTAAWVATFAQPNGPDAKYLRDNGHGGDLSSYVNAEVLIDHRDGGELYYGALTQGTTDFQDPGMEKTMKDLELTDVWAGRWSNILKMGAIQPRPEHAVFREAKLGAATLFQQPFVAQQGIDPLEFFKLENKIATTLQAAPFVSVTGYASGSAKRDGERHAQAFAITWSAQPMPANPDNLPPTDGDAPKWVLAGRINAAFDAARFDRPEVYAVKCLTDRTSKGHIWEMKLRLYGGVQLADVRAKAQLLRQHIGSGWLRVAQAKDGCVIVAGVDPNDARGLKYAGAGSERPVDVAREKEYRDYVTSLDWEQAFADAKVVSAAGFLPKLIGSGTLPKNEDVQVLDFQLPTGTDRTMVKVAVPKLAVATRNGFVEPRPGIGGADTIRLLVSPTSPLPDVVGVDWEAVDELAAEGSLPFATSVEGEPVVFNPKRDPHALVVGATGGGKNQELSALLPVPVSGRFQTGWAMNKDLVVGDRVYAPDGSLTTIIGFSNIVTEDVYDVTFSDGQTVGVGANHLWKVSTVDSRSRQAPRQTAPREQRLDEFGTRADELRAMATIYSAGAVAGLETIAGIAGYSTIVLYRMGALKPLGTEALVPTAKKTSRYDGVAMQLSTVYPIDEVLTILADCVEHQVTRGSWGGVVPLESVLDTKTMLFATVRHETAARSTFNYAVRLTQPILGDVEDLPVDPYVLGAWLGDGSSQNGQVASGAVESCTDSRGITDRSYVIEQVKKHYPGAHPLPSSGWLITLPGLPADLRRAGVLDDKHIPAQYLRASVEQRLALLQGLMDTNGHIEANGGSEIDLCDKKLADGVLELVRSLGIRVTQSEAAAKITEAGPDNPGQTRQCQDSTRYRMKFTTDMPVFRLPLKLERIPKTLRATQRWNYITDIRVREAQPMRCIKVDHPEHLYLTHGFIPTHNSVSLQMLLYPALVSGADLYVIDPTKGGADFRFAEPYSKAFAATVPEAEAVMKAVYSEVMRRKNLNSEHGVGGYRELPESVRPNHIYVVMDEFTSLMQPDPVSKVPSDDPEVEFERQATTDANNAKIYIGTMAGKIAREARSAGVTLVLATQKLSAKMLDTIPGANDLKAVSLDTLLPVPVSNRFPDGWARNRDLCAGDLVFTPYGTTTPILGFSEVFRDKSMYAVTFDDGQVVHASGDHLWQVSGIRPGEQYGYEASEKYRRADVASALAESPELGRWHTPSELAELLGYETSASIVRLAARFGTARAVPDRVTGGAQPYNWNTATLYHAATAVSIIAASHRRLASGLAKLELDDSLWLTSRELVELATGLATDQTTAGNIGTILLGCSCPSAPQTNHAFLYRSAPFLRDLANYLRSPGAVDGTTGSPLTRERILTTEQLREGMTGLDGQRSPRWAVQNPEPIFGSHVDLAVDPYVLGSWLGGSRGRGSIALKCAGNLKARLRKIGVLNDQRIPARYLRASFAQRLAVLQGFMDTDCATTVAGHCSSYQSSRKLAGDVLELLRSLGIKASWDEQPPIYRLAGSDEYKYTGTTYCISFRTNLPAFRLPLKLAEQKRNTDGDSSTTRRLIRTIKKIATEPSRCIGVADDRHLFLVEGFVPTHNTNLARMLMGNATYGEKMSALKSPEEAPPLGDVVPKGRGLWESTEANAEIIQVWFEPSQESLALRLAERRSPLGKGEKLDMAQILAKSKAKDEPILHRPVAPRELGEIEEEVVGEFEFSLDDLDLDVVDEDDDFGPDPAGLGLASRTVVLVVAGTNADEDLLARGMVMVLPAARSDEDESSGWWKIDAALRLLATKPSTAHVVWIDPELGDDDAIGIPHHELVNDVFADLGLSVDFEFNAAAADTAAQVVEPAPAPSLAAPLLRASDSRPDRKTAPATASAFDEPDIHATTAKIVSDDLF